MEYPFIGIISIATSKAILGEMNLSDEVIVLNQSNKIVDEELEEKVRSLVSKVSDTNLFEIIVEKVGVKDITITYFGIKLPPKKENLVEFFDEYFTKPGLVKLVITYDGYVNVYEAYDIPNNAPVLIEGSEKKEKVDPMKVLIVKEGKGYTFTPDNLLREILQQEVVELMIEKGYKSVVVDTDGKKILGCESRDLEVFNQEKEYVDAIIALEELLESEYKGKDFQLRASGFNRSKWQFTTNDIELKLSDELEITIVQILHCANIKFVQIDWDGSEFKSFFPIDVFTKIVSLRKDFDAAVVLKNGFKMLEISSELTDVCDALSIELNDESYIDIALAYSDMVELVQTLELQENMLMDLLANETVRTDEIAMLYKNFVRNVDEFENAFPGSDFVNNLAIFDKDYNNLVDTFDLTEQGFQDSYYQLTSYLKENYQSIFTIKYSDGALYIDDKEAAFDPKLKLIFTIFRDVICSENLQLTWNVDSVSEVIADEIPYERADILPLCSEYWDEYKELKEVTDEEIMNHFMFPLDEDEDASVMFEGYDMVDLNYTGPSVMPGMENVTNEDWAKYLNPDEHSQFRQKWFYDEVGEPEETADDLDEDEEHVDALVVTANSLSGMNLSEKEEQKFITKELRGLGFERLGKVKKTKKNKKQK